MFGLHGQDYQAVIARVTSFHEQLVQALSAGANLYAATEAANAAAAGNPWQVLQQQVLNAINTPTEMLLARALIGNGTHVQRQRRRRRQRYRR